MTHPRAKVGKQRSFSSSVSEKDDGCTILHSSFVHQQIQYKAMAVSLSYKATLNQGKHVQGMVYKRHPKAAL